MSTDIDFVAAAETFDFYDQDIPWLLAHWARVQPDKTFLIWEPRNGEVKTWSYAQFWRDVRAVAAGLAARGVKQTDKVLLHAENCPEVVIAWYACATLGAVAVTTNTRCVGGEIEYFARHTRAVGAITQPQYLDEIRNNAKALQWIVVTEDDAGEAASVQHDLPLFGSLHGDPESLPARKREPMLPAGILFTSGTTSLPKAVVHTHANMLWAGRIAPNNLQLGKHDVYLAFLPFFHVNAQSWAIWSVLGAGATVVLQPKFSASRFWEVVQRHSVTHMSAIPFVFKAIATQPMPETHTIRVLVMGIIWKEISAWLRAQPFACWGMTETVTHATRSDFVQDWPAQSIGKPTPGYRLAVVNPETGALCKAGEIGELWVHGVRGVQLFLEYYDNPEANAKSFTPSGWFKTGDMVRIGEEGNYYFCDRDKDMLKVGGENVSARQVEEVCMQAGNIAEVAVVGRKHEMLDEVAVAFVIKAPGAPADDAFASAIIEHCKKNLADFKVPRAVYFVDEMPRATLEKVAKNKLREMAEAMPPL